MTKHGCWPHPGTSLTLPRKLIGSFMPSTYLFLDFFTLLTHPPCAPPLCATERKTEDRSPRTGTSPAGRRVNLSQSVFFLGSQRSLRQLVISSVALGNSVTSLSLSVLICQWGE